jgi:hypothetical protein
VQACLHRFESETAEPAEQQSCRNNGDGLVEAAALLTIPCASKKAPPSPAGLWELGMFATRRAVLRWRSNEPMEDGAASDIGLEVSLYIIEEITVKLWLHPRIIADWTVRWITLLTLPLQYPTRHGR